MSSSASLLGGVFEITRGDLENAVFPFISPDQFFRSLTAIRITRVSEFWKNSHATVTSALLYSTEDLIRGFFARKCAWTFALCGRDSEIQCWFGTPSAALDRASLETFIRSSFPDARISTERLDSESLRKLRSGVVFTGTPSAKCRTNETIHRDQLGHLCRAMFGNHWLYIVAATPLPPVETVRRLNEVAEKIRDTQANFLLPTSPIDEENRTGRRYVDLLEAKLRRLERGRISGMWDLRCSCYAATEEAVETARHVLESAYSGEESLPDPVRVRPLNPSAPSEYALEPLTTSEAAVLAQMPREEYPGFELVEAVRFGVEPTGTTGEDVVQIGEIIDRGIGTGNWFNLSRADLTKHALIAGVTGSGKTNTCQWLLDQMWDNGRGVPFLVIESAKSEYRNLLLNPRFSTLRVFTVGDETVAPLRLNPFEVPAGILVQTHIDYLKSLFSAAFVLYPPMPYVLEQALQEIYEDRGWDVARNTNSRGTESPRCAPILDDLAAKIPVVVDRMGYDQRISMDVKAGLLARVNQLRLAGGKGLLLNTRSSVHQSALFEKPCVLELKQLVSDDEKAFIIGLLLIRLYEYHETLRERPLGLVHMTLIEEAHRLLRNASTDQSSEVSPNPRGRAVEVFTNILSEIRAFGEGIVVAEQVPAKLAPDVVKNTGLKLIHRLVSPDDRALLGGAVNLDDSQIRRLATLAAGEGVAWSEKTAKALLIRAPLAQSTETGRVPDDALRSQNQAPGLDGSWLLPFEACRTCPTSASGACRSQPRDQWDRPLRLAFRRAFNAVRRCPAAIAPTFEEFRHLVGRASRPSDAISPLCTFIAMAEGEIERRGEFKGWQFTDVDFLIASLADISRLVLSAIDQGVTPVIPESVISTFQARCDDLHRVATLPFPGCRYCEAPCSFRFDMAGVEAATSRDFQRAFLDVDVPTERVSRLSRTAASRSFFVSDVASCSGAALCFAVQQLARPDLDLTTYHQAQVASVLKQQLSSRK